MSPPRGHEKKLYISNDCTSQELYNFTLKGTAPSAKCELSLYIQLSPHNACYSAM